MNDSKPASRLIRSNETSDLGHEVMMAASAGLVMFAACLVSIELAKLIGRGVPIWPANAVAVFMMLSTRPSRWPYWLAAILIGDWGASVLCGEGLLQSLALSSCNAVCIAATVAGVRRFIGDRLDLSVGSHLFRFCLIAGLAAPFISAVMAGVTLGGLDKSGTWLLLWTWMIANGLGAIVFTPLLLTLKDQKRYLAATPLTPMAVLSLVLLAAATAFAFSIPRPTVFLIPPALLLVVFQLETVGAAWGVLVVVAISITATAMKLGPVRSNLHNPTETVVVVQMFFAAITLMSLPTASALAHRRRLRAEVVESEARYRLMTETSRDVVLKHGLDGRILFASQSVRQFGYEPASLIGRCSFDLIHPDDRERSVGGLRRLLDASDIGPEQMTSEFRALLPNGEYVWVEGNPSVIRDEAGAPVAFTNALRNIANRKLIEAELLAAREAAEAAVAVKSDFLANMSHELRTPLTSVLGFTRLALQQPDLSETSLGYIRKASNAGEALLATVNDILDFSKLETGQMQIRPTPCDPALVCRETLELFSEAAAARNVSLRLAAGQLPDRLLFDPDRVRQLLLNLVGNAVKFSDHGEIVLTVQWREVDQHLCATVTDQGPGIAPEQQALLFRRFSQVDGTSTRRHGGTGLGLAICQGLVDAMGGTIGVTSAPGLGAAFHFAIPAPVTTDACPADDDAGEELQFPEHARILVADDHPANRELVRAVLTPFGAEVHEAHDGADAVRLASQTAFDLILMDLRMPELDGLGAMTAIRSGQGPNQATPILAFSAAADAVGAESRRIAGFDGDLPKPVMPANLLLAVCIHASATAQHRNETDPATRDRAQSRA